MRSIIPLLLLTACFGNAALAQTDPPAPDAAVQLSPTPQAPVCNDYFLTTDEKLSFKQQACLYRSNVITPSAVFGAAIFAGIDQAHNTPAEWRQGFVGYSRRFGSNMGQSVAKSTGQFLASAVMHEDPRFRSLASIEKTPSTGWARFFKALTGPLVIWEPRPRPRTGCVVGSLASGFAGLAYYPESQLRVSQAFVRSGTAFGGYVAYSIFTEYQPDMFRKIGEFLGSSSRPKKKREVN